jgi:hypothetical protein
MKGKIKMITLQHLFKIDNGIGVVEARVGNLEETCENIHDNSCAKR